MKKITIFRTGIILVFLITLLINTSFSQSRYDFQTIKRLDATPVKAQGKTGTCWVFSTLSMLESELLRMGKGQWDLAEMFVVRQSYIDRADLYVKFHGHLNFTMGAQAWDVMNVIRDDGITPQQAYPGFKMNESMHEHVEMDAVLKSFINTVIENKSGKLSPVWKDAFEGILDGYLGQYPESFTYEGKTYTPSEFRDFLEIQPDDYIPFTSFMEHEYYSTYVFESPDNWSLEEIHNLPLDVMVEMMKESVRKGYTLAWAADVSDPGFRHDKGLAVVPEKDWKYMDEEEREKVFAEPIGQRKIRPEVRQKNFSNYSTTDDHLMHIVGLAKDQKGTEYFIVKNSWGTDNPFDGYLYVSEAYVKLRTTSIMLNKNAISDAVLDKLEL